MLQQEPELLGSSPVVSGPANCFQSCNLCANGAVALTTREDRVIEVYALPLETPEPTALLPSRQFAQSENILGTLWYPTAVPEDPASYCFLASVKECPVKLLDASDGRLRASYRIVDHRERQIAPHSMAFNSTISKIYCGFQDAIEVFDINYPGEGERIFTTPSKKSRTGLKGIISSLAFSPDFSGLYAAGTFSSSLVLFDESSKGEIVQYLEGTEGAITQVKFNPMAPHLVYASSRQSNHISCWDIRGDTTSPIKKYVRSGLTNQRISFDIDVCGGLLVTGDKDGFISCYDLNEDRQDPVLKFKGHNGAPQPFIR
ncbi:WD40 repeat-like protein [Hysterangium stoloniferum]|nr:WD40 repeat-like protein [Hysterangium stoloniferum]